MGYWLMKSEPKAYSIDDLARDHRTTWDGVRNHQARNLMRDAVKIRDQVLFYHSSANPPGVVGLAQICREAYPDFTAWDPNSSYFDPKSSPDQPRWFMVDVEFLEKFPLIVTLSALKANPALANMLVVRRGQRLSVRCHVAPNPGHGTILDPSAGRCARDFTWGKPRPSNRMD